MALSFTHAVLLLMHSLSQLNHLSIQFYDIYHCSRLAFCLICALPPLEKFLTQIIFLVAAALFMLFQVKLILSPKQKANPQQAEQGHAQIQQCV